MFRGNYNAFGEPARSAGRDLAMRWAVTRMACLAFAALAAMLAGGQAQAQDGGLIKPGDAVVTGFSGVKADAKVPADVHPLDRTFIDLDGNSAQVFDLSVLGTAPRGQLSETPAKLQIKARDVGQTFGVTLDDGKANGGAPNAYLAATSMFGLNLVGKSDSGQVNRVLTGAKGAEWMPGQFGPGGPGAIYKIDGMTGAASVFATLKADGRVNAGAGLGNVAFDPASEQFFVSDLETGLIYRLARDGAVRSAFDHGVTARTGQKLDPVEFDGARRIDIANKDFNTEDPATWGYADVRRRVFGVAVHRGRLYYANAEGPAIWSVGLTADGDFGNDARIEFDVAEAAAGPDVTDIAFDGSGLMYLTQRGAPIGSYDYSAFATADQAHVLRYRYDEQAGRWSASGEEYAVGLKAPHRAGEGGLAFNYGYDKNGNLDRGACRQTLWTTGGQLRQGEDVQRVSLGGASVVNGLQGVFLSSVRPENEPPYRSWFADYDGRTDDAQARGHIGDVAIFAPCTPEVRPDTRVETYVPPYIPPVDEPDLIIDKHCFAAPIGGKVKCTISVQNVGDDFASEGITIKDVTKIMFGPGAGSLAPVVEFVIPNPAIACAVAPSPDFWCTIPAALLAPGDVIAIDVWVDTGPLMLAGNAGFRNCAVLNHPDGYGKACAEGGADIVVEKIGPGVCLPGGTCKFGLKIANAGLEAFDGDVLLADAMFIGGGVPNVPVTAVNPPIACSAGNTAQLPFTCLTHLSLMPGEEHLHWIEVTMPAPGGNYWAQNCFGALDASLFPVAPLPPGFGGGGAGNPSCVWVHVKEPSANLRVEKKALDGGVCSKVGDNLQCKYEIGVANENAVDFLDVVKIDETVPAGATIIAASAPWACAGGPPTYSCETGAALPIPAGGKTTFEVTLQMSVADSEATDCQVPNGAKIASPVAGLAPNLDATDDEAGAVASTFGIIWWIGPIKHVVCDPTNQIVKKIAKGPCEKTGDGFKCGYDVTITNEGPDPYEGPYKLTEKFAVAPTSVSFSGGDFSCAGGGAEYACETPIKMRAVGETVTLKVTATVPDNGMCELPNTAALTMPAVGTAGNNKAGDDQATATANVPSERCRKTTVTPVPRCPDGLPIPRSGKCPAPVDEGCTPGRDEIKTSSGACVCRNGFSRDNGRCVEDEDEPQGCTPGVNEVKLGVNRCVCREGFERNRDGRCMPERDDDSCKPGPNEVKTAKGRCVCREDFVRDGSGRCVPERIDCGKGQHLDNGKCVPDKYEEGCEDGAHKNKRGVCVPDDDPAGDCVKRGWTWTGKRCVEPANPAEDCRAAGRVWTGKRCVDAPNPGDDCRKSGGNWTGARCVYPPRECARGYIGTPPNCRLKLPEPAKSCPLGARGKWPNCIPIPDRRCPPGLQGVPPNCFRKPPKLDIKPKLTPQIIKPKLNFGGQNPAVRRQQGPGPGGFNPKLKTF